MANVALHTATPDDLPGVLSLIEALLRELGEEGDEAGRLPRERLAVQLPLLGDRHIAFVATDPDGTMVGVLTLAVGFAIYAGGEYGVINEMYVVPERRSSSIGALLVAEAAAYGRRQGWRRIDVTAPEANRWTRTRSFYERQGFVFTGPKLRLPLEKPPENGA